MASMLRGGGPYLSTVRIGEKFQAKVPDWSGPIIKYTMAQSEFHESEHQSDDERPMPSVRSDLPRSQSVNAQSPDDQLILSSDFLDLKPNNHHLDFDTMKSDYPVILEILKGHPLNYALTATANIPLIYLRQFWHTITYFPEEHNCHFEAYVDQFMMKLTKKRLRLVLSLPEKNEFQGKQEYDEFATESELYADILSLGYSQPLSTSAKFKRMYLPPIWYTLFSILNRCLTPKHTGVDRCNIHVLRLFHGVVFNKHYDYSTIFWNELEELVAAKANSRARKFVPYQRFLQLIIQSMMRSNRDIPTRSSAPVCPEYEMQYLRKLDETEFQDSLPLPAHLLAYADQDAQSVREYREFKASMVQPVPKEPTQEAISREDEQREVSSNWNEQDQATGVPDQGATRENVTERGLEGDGSVPLSAALAELPIPDEPEMPEVHSDDERTESDRPEAGPDASDDDDASHDFMSDLHIENVIHKATILEGENEGDLVENEERLSGGTIKEHGESVQVSLESSAILSIPTTHLCDEAGTSRVAPSTGILQGPDVSPTRVDDIPALNVGHTVDSTVVSTGNLCGPVVTHPEYVSREYFHGALKAVQDSFTAQLDALKHIYKGKEIVTDLPPPPPPQPPVQQPEDLSVAELKSMLYAKLLSQATDLDSVSSDLLRVLRRSIEAEVDTLDHFNSMKQEIASSLNKEKTLQNLIERVQALEDSCKQQADSRKRKHDDHEDPYHHEGEMKRQKMTEDGLDSKPVAIKHLSADDIPSSSGQQPMVSEEAVKNLCSTISKKVSQACDDSLQKNARTERSIAYKAATDIHDDLLDMLKDFFEFWEFQKNVEMGEAITRLESLRAQKIKLYRDDIKKFREDIAKVLKSQEQALKATDERMAKGLNEVSSALDSMKATIEAIPAPTPAPDLSQPLKNLTDALTTLKQTIDTRFNKLETDPNTLTQKVNKIENTLFKPPVTTHTTEPTASVAPTPTQPIPVTPQPESTSPAFPSMFSPGDDKKGKELGKRKSIAHKSKPPTKKKKILILSSHEKPTIVYR